MQNHLTIFPYIKRKKKSGKYILPTTSLEQQTIYLYDTNNKYKLK